MLSHGYQLVNSALLRYGDTDHVLIGPGGLFVFETKWGSTAWDLERQDRIAAAALRQLELKARDVHLTTAHTVTPVLVFWGKAAGKLESSGRPMRALPSGVVVLCGSALERWALGRPRGVLTDAEVVDIHGRISDLTKGNDSIRRTWTLREAISATQRTA